ncbi:SRPBCC family protein [Longimicrobium sp.]|uniref:SRPBCC family protein n=1 Tax=Longimicrobium sp. TaxID=2029185 RepID=UPI002E322B54|nr:SRPBCC family protein [Longimicrobium sp.]HEX6038294.1 SRPBCC family protein [Longimicrobium sp.]
MAEIIISETAVMQAAPEIVYGIFADYHEAHPGVLPRPHFGTLVVERGGTGEGTRFTIDIRQGMGRRTYRMDVTEPRPGRLLVETDLDSDLTTTFAVEPDGGGSRVTITTRFTQGRLGGWLMKTFGPRLAAPIYREELRNVERLARQRAAAVVPA